MSINTKVSNPNMISGRISQPTYNPVSNPVASDSFYQSKPVTVREMITRRINKTLCICLLFTIVVTFISYYIAMNFEAKLNALDREIVRINTENFDLQSDLDKYKSFNNVDSKIGEFKLLQKADKVLEVTALNSQEVIPHTQKTPETSFNWAIGY